MNRINSDPILIQRRTSPKELNEDIKVVHNVAILREIPNKFSKVIINSTTQMFEVDRTHYKKGLLKANEYYVDYQLGFIYFNEANDNLTFNVDYAGMGMILYPASRIYMKDRDGIIDDLQSILDASTEAIKIINRLDEIITHSDELYVQLNTAIQNGTKLNIELQTTIDLANQTKNILNGAVQDGVNKIEEIDNKIIEVEQKTNDLVTSADSKVNNKLNEVSNKIIEINLAELNREKVKEEMQNMINDYSLFESYDNTKTYEPLNKVCFNGSSYQCKKETIGIEPTNEIYWTLIALKGKDVEGSGDMSMSTYDTNENGVVDNAEKVNGFTVDCNVPSNAKFTDTVYDDTEIKSNVTNLQNTMPNKADLVNGKVPSSQLDLSEYGAGDMMKSVYDKDGDGIVDNSKLVTGHTVECDIPSNLIENVNKNIDDIKLLKENKVDTVEGKVLSSNDFTNEDKNKLNSLSNVASSGNYNDLNNKPIIPTKTSELNNDSDFVNQTELNELNNKITVFNATCTYDTNYNLSIENNPTLPNYFTLRFKTPNNYIEGKTFNIGSDTYTPKNASFETADIVSVEFDKVNKKCFFKVGGGSGVNETLPPQIENFNVISGNAKLDLTWTIPDATYLSGYVFTVKENSIPSNANDGVKYEIDKSKTSCEINGLTNGIQYYVRPFPYNNKKQYQSEYVVGNGTPQNGLTLKDLPIGSKIKFGKYQVESETPQPIVFIKADNNHYKDENNSNITDHVTLITEKIIDLRAFDAIEPNNSDGFRRSYGNNRYSYSNQRQWLNSNQTNWFTKQHSADEPPTNSGTGDYNTGYDTRAGFLNLFSESEINSIIPTELKVAKASVDGGGFEIVNDKVFLLSETEAGLGNENGIVEGKVFSMFSDDSSRQVGVTEQCFNNSKSTSKPSSSNINWRWYLRTPNTSYSHVVWYVNPGGSLGDYNAAYYGDYGVRPALNLNSEVQVSLTPDIDGCYVVV